MLKLVYPFLFGLSRYFYVLFVPGLANGRKEELWSGIKAVFYFCFYHACSSPKKSIRREMELKFTGRS
jgi:hypothetical protein